MLRLPVVGTVVVCHFEHLLQGFIESQLCLAAPLSLQVFLYALQALAYIGYGASLGEFSQLQEFLAVLHIVHHLHHVVDKADGCYHLRTEVAALVLVLGFLLHLSCLGCLEFPKCLFHVVMMLGYSLYGFFIWLSLEIIKCVEHRQFPRLLVIHQIEYLSEVGLEEYECII